MAPPRKKRAASNKNSLPSSSHHPLMASSPPAKRVRIENLPYIHEHIIFSEILPFLSVDELDKLKCVCKSWCNFISSNTMPPLHRFRRRYHDVSSSYSGVLFPECNSNGQLVFLPTTTLLGDDVVPDSMSVSFSQEPCKEIVACTNGLLCLKCSGNDNDDIYYVCNPLTQEGHIIPLSNSWHDTPEEKVCVWRSSIGLAYDPSKSPAQYKLVCPLSHFDHTNFYSERIDFGFEVFSSQTNRWDKSCNKYYVEMYDFFDHIYGSPNAMKSTYAGGALFWNCRDYLMHFDPERGYGGPVHFPFQLPINCKRDDYKIGEFKGHVSLSRVSIGGGMQLWILHLDVDNRSSSTSYRWELMHQVSFETVIENNPYVFRSAFCLDTKLPRRKNREEVEIMFKNFRVIHLPYGGGERLFMRVGLGKKKQENVLCYDANSGKLNKFCTISQSTDHRYNFLYRSSMVSLPKLGKA